MKSESKQCQKSEEESVHRMRRTLFSSQIRDLFLYDFLVHQQMPHLLYCCLYLLFVVHSTPINTPWKQRRKQMSSYSAWEPCASLVPVMFCIVYCLQFTYVYFVNLYVYIQPDIYTADRDWAGCYCETAVTHPWYSLDSPIGSPMNTCVHKQKNKRSMIAISFSSSQTYYVYWKEFWQPGGLLSCLDPRKPQRALLHCWKTPLVLVAVLLRDPPLLVFVIVNNQDKLPIINNIALTLTPVLPEWVCFHIQPSFLYL